MRKLLYFASHRLHCVLLLLVLPLSWNYIDSKDGESVADREVEVRGFLYPWKESAWILAPEPYLKTCCVGSTEKATRQIAIFGEVPKHTSGQVMIVQGVFKKRFNAEVSSEGPHYEILDAKVEVLKKQKYEAWGILGVLGVLALGGWLFLKSR